MATDSKATEMVVAFGHAADARLLAASLAACEVAATVEGRDVIVPMTSARNDEVARNLIGATRVYYR